MTNGYNDDKSEDQFSTNTKAIIEDVILNEEYIFFSCSRHDKKHYNCDDLVHRNNITKLPR